MYKLCEYIDRAASCFKIATVACAIGAKFAASSGVTAAWSKNRSYLRKNSTSHQKGAQGVEFESTSYNFLNLNLPVKWSLGFGLQLSVLYSFPSPFCFLIHLRLTLSTTECSVQFSQLCFLVCSSCEYSGSRTPESFASIVSFLVW